jgi:hypothetical protein
MLGLGTLEGNYSATSDRHALMQAWEQIHLVAVILN